MGLYMERDLSVNDLYTDKYDNYLSLTKIFVRETTNILRFFEFTKVSGRKTVP